MPFGILQHKRRLQLAALLVLLPIQDLSLAAEITPEMVRATYILKMQPFFELGNPPHHIKKICYYEKPDTPYEESVGQIIDKYYAEHADSAVTVQRFSAIRDFSGCDLFYIPSTEEGNVDSILASLGSSPTLTVSATPQFVYKGGMIGFVLDNANHIKLEASLKNIKSKNIQADPQILEIMQQVIN